MGLVLLLIQGGFMGLLLAYFEASGWEFWIPITVNSIFAALMVHVEK